MIHSFRYAWAERTKVAGYQERFAQEVLGHNGKAVHRVYAKKAIFLVASLEEFEAKATKDKLLRFPSPSDLGNRGPEVLVSTLTLTGDQPMTEFTATDSEGNQVFHDYQFKSVNYNLARSQKRFSFYFVHLFLIFLFPSYKSISSTSI